MQNELQILLAVTGRLEAAGIAYMVSGSVAMNYYAQPRLTRDIDIVVELSMNDVPRIVDLFSGDFYMDEEMVRAAVTRQGMFNIIHNEQILKVDFIIRKDTFYRMEEFSRRRFVKIDGFLVWLVAIEDLILSKLVWAREGQSTMQLNDVRNLLTSNSDLDSDYIARWAIELDIADLWESVWTHWIPLKKSTNYTDPC